MPRYRYLLATILGDRTIAEVPLRDVKFGFGLNGPADWTASLPLAPELVRTIDPEAATTPAKIALWVERDGSIVYSGPLWHRKYDSRTHRFELGGSDWTSYLAARYLSANRNYAGFTGPGVVADLVEYLASFPNGDARFEVDASRAGGSPVIAELAFEASELRHVDRILAELADAGAFDYGFEYAWVGNARVKRLALHYPSRGRAFEATRLVLTHPGQIESYVEPEDGTDIATDLFVLGAGEGRDALRARRTNDAAHANGYPRLNRSWSYTDLTSPIELAALADTAERVYSEPSVDLDLVLDPRQAPELGAYVPGDEVEYRITDLRHPNGLTARQRIGTIEVQPGQDEQPERVTLKLAGPREVIRS